MNNIEEVIKEIRSYIPKPYMASFNKIVAGKDWWRDDFLIYYRDLLVGRMKSKKVTDPHSLVLPSPLFALDRFLKDWNANSESEEPIGEPVPEEEIHMAEDLQENETFDDAGEILQPEEGETYEENLIEEPVEG